MTNILHIDSSAKTQGSVTRKLTAEVMARLCDQYPDAKVKTRDLTLNPIPHIGPEFLAGIFMGGDFATHESVQLSDRLIEELLMADIVVIGAPMYNYSIPSQLKAWIDHVLRARKTFRYSEDGRPIGLVTGKKAILVAAHGGLYSEGFMQPFDHVVPLMRQVLGHIGITDVSVIRAEKQAMGPDHEKQGMAGARHDIETALHPGGST